MVIRYFYKVTQKITYNFDLFLVAECRENAVSAAISPLPPYNCGVRLPSVIIPNLVLVADHCPVPFPILFFSISVFMAEAPSLLFLCTALVRDEIVRSNHIISIVLVLLILFSSAFLLLLCFLNPLFFLTVRG